MSALLTKIGQLAVFLICAQTLVHFRPKGSYEKYIKLLVSMMLLILLVEPLMNLLGKGERGDFMEQVRVYEQRLQEILETPQLKNDEIELLIENITRERVEEGTAYVQKQADSGQTESQGTKKQEDAYGNAAENADEQPEAIKVQVEIKEIQEVEVGTDYGKTAGTD